MIYICSAVVLPSDTFILPWYHHKTFKGNALLIL